MNDELFLTSKIELKDLFAMQAMQMFMRGSAFTGHNYDYIAKHSYELAEAMLKAKEEIDINKKNP